MNWNFFKRSRNVNLIAVDKMRRGKILTKRPRQKNQAYLSLLSFTSLLTDKGIASDWTLRCARCSSIRRPCKLAIKSSIPSAPSIKYLFYWYIYKPNQALCFRKFGKEFQIFWNPSFLKYFTYIHLSKSKEIFSRQITFIPDSYECKAEFVWEIVKNKNFARRCCKTKKYTDNLTKTELTMHAGKIRSWT